MVGYLRCNQEILRLFHCLHEGGKAASVIVRNRSG